MNGRIKVLENGDVRVRLFRGKPMPEFLQDCLEQLSAEQSAILLKWLHGEDLVRQEMIELLAESEE